VPAQLDVRYRVGEELGLAPPDSLEYFLVERYLLYTRWGRLGLMAGRVSHRAYPLQRAEVTDLACRTMLESVGLPAPAGPPHVLFSPGVDVEVFPLRRAA
jgi:uncharacterized protein YqjF (DUF2071 family)